MSEAKQVRIGIIGTGSMGGHHARELLAGKVARAKLTAVCDTDPKALEPFAELSRFDDGAKLIRSGQVDAVLVATPHYDHTPISIDALGQGLHVLTEKPMAVHKADCEKMIAAYDKRPDKKQLFAEMFQMRTERRYRKLREMVTRGEVGPLRRISWIITDWFRSEAYYRSGGWRATWRGEGGGVLLNQCPHNIDLWQWIFGMPKRVHAFCGFGRFHEIEVEDQVTAYFEYEGGATGVFVTTTGEAPGTNRLEVCGEQGKIVIEGDSFVFVRNETQATEFSRSTSERFAAPAVWNVSVPVSAGGPMHNGIWQNFINAILDGEPLMSPAVEGIHSVELANAMLYSAWTGQSVSLPLDAAAYARELDKRIATSRYVKPGAAPSKGPVDMSSSFR
jgi:predicted dehydrogenase